MRLMHASWALALAGCRSADALDDVGVICTDTPRPLAAAEASPLGFGPSDVLAAGGTAFAGWVRWTDAAESAIGITVDPGESVVARFVESVADDPARAEECWSHVEIDVVVDVRSQDGRLDETLPGTLMAMDTSMTTFRHDLSEPAGTLDLAAFVPEDTALGTPESQAATFEWTITGPGLSYGTITGTARWAEQTADDGTGSASQASFDIASFSTEVPSRR